MCYGYFRVKTTTSLGRARGVARVGVSVCMGEEMVGLGCRQGLKLCAFRKEKIGLDFLDAR